MYGVRERQFRRYVRDAQASRDRTGDRTVEALERRVDNVIYRLGFATTARRRGSSSATATCSSTGGG